MPNRIPLDPKLPKSFNAMPNDATIYQGALN